MSKHSPHSNKNKSRIYATMALALVIMLLSMDATVFASRSLHFAMNKPSIANTSVAAEDADDEAKNNDNNKDEDKDKGGDKETDEPTEWVKRIYLKNDEPDNNGKRHYVGEDFDPKYKTLEIEEKGKTVQLNGYYITNKSSVEYETSNSSSPLGVIELDWKSSDNKIATVSPDGKITPIKDGKVKITAKVSDKSKYKDDPPEKVVNVEISGQSGKYVSKVQIVDKNGKSLSSKDDALTVIEEQNSFFEFYARVTWHDPDSGEDTIEDTTGGKKISSTITWSVGGSKIVGTINEDTGRFKASEYSGNCYVQCVVSGGKNGKDVKDTADVMIDTGKYEYNPANSLKLKVVYQKYPDDVVQKHTYSLKTLSKRLSTRTNSYTIMGNGRYGTIRAKGYLFKDIVGLEDISLDDVHQFRFTTADDYDNPITTKMLYGSGSRYYFPNWDIGSKSGAKVVPPILATESNMIWGESEVSADTPLDKGSRFRLVFGSLWNKDSNSSYQIYYIREITIVLKGAPSAKDGNGPSKGTGGDDDKGIGNGSGTDGRGGGAGSDQGDGSGNSAGNSGDKSSAGRSGKAGNSKGDKGKPGSPHDSNSDKSGGNLRVYEMMSNSKSNVASLNKDLPYLPAALPIAVGGLMAGGLSSYISFRRRIL